VGGDVISWSTGETADSIFVEPLVPTEYILTVTSAGCIDQDTISVSVNPQPVANAGEDDVIVSGGSTMLEALGGTMNSTYAWYPSVGLSDTTSANPVAKPEETTMYQLIIQDGLGCVDTDYVEVIVVPSVVIPTGITPNGDGKNDTWQLEYITQFPNPVVEIYNRWGQLVYRSEGYLENWDGTDGDKDLPVGTYYYIIDLGEGVEPITGPLTLMR
jgi:gliding motility-associated-like protein